MTSVSTEIVTGAFVTKQAKTRRRGAGDGASLAMDMRVAGDEVQQCRLCPCLYAASTRAGAGMSRVFSSSR